MKKAIKAVTFLTVLVVMVLAFSGCGGGNDSITDDLVGVWLFEGQPYYTLNSDGTGTMADFGAIRWATDSGIFSVCITPNDCASVSRCSESMDWRYTLAGNNLNLTSTVIAGMTFDYTRQP